MFQGVLRDKDARLYLMPLPEFLWSRILSAKALLDENSNANEEEIKDAIAGNLCRCTGYVQIIDSIKSVSGYFQEEEPQVVAWKTEDGDRGD